MESFSILSGAGLIDASEAAPIYVHQTSRVQVKEDNTIVLPDLACWNGSLDAASADLYHGSADIFVMVLKDGEVNAEPCIPAPAGVKHDMANKTTTITCYSHAGVLKKDEVVLVDYYVKRTGGAHMIEITAESFSGNFYLEGSTLFRRESDGIDMPAEFIIPNGKIQSNFTFSMAATGDPSTFSFVMDAFPDYTKFDPTKKVLAAIQLISDESGQIEGVREACGETVTVYESDAANVSVTFMSISADKAEIEVEGTVSGMAYNTEWYPGGPAKAVQFILEMPVEPTAKYELVTENPIYDDYFASDPSIVGNVKTQERTGAELAEGLAILLSEEPGDVTVSLSRITAAGKTLEKEYVITNSLVFA